jgi:hypothetical protein
MRDVWPLNRAGLQPRALHFSYEKAGLTIHDQPIPWNAEAVLVEAALRLPPSGTRRKSEFLLRLPGNMPILPENMRREDGEDIYRLQFRFAPPPVSTGAELMYKERVLGQLTLPRLSQEEFLRNIQLHQATLSVRIGQHSIACQTYVASQCRGLIASALFSSPTSLVPLLDLDPHLELRSEKGSKAVRVAAALASSQLTGRQALVTLVPARFPRHIGAWQATWMIGGRAILNQQFRAISQSTFRRSLRVSETRFVVERGDRSVGLSRHLPPTEGLKAVGPCFLISSREPGVAALCPLQVSTQVNGAIRAPLLCRQEILITDGPTVFAPGFVDAADLPQVSAFELRCKTGTLGILSLSPIPAASFNGEGAFRPAPEFQWSVAADDELSERLGRLFETKGN